MDLSENSVWTKDKLKLCLIMLYFPFTI